MTKNINVAEPQLIGNELKYVSQCVESGWISSQGDFVTSFEKGFTEYIGSSYSLSVSNGTTALHLALVALGIKPGDEVMVPNLTFAATANVVIHIGAKPVLVDVGPDSWTVDLQDLERKITSKTKAIVPVHLYGASCEMDELMAIAERHSLFVVEDCAESLGAEFHSSKLGTFGHVGCFSFFANKIMTTGEGGMVVTSDPQLHDRMVILRDHGMEKGRRYWHVVPGFNYRLTNLQAAVGQAQLESLPKFLERRNEIARWYREGLKNISGVVFQQFVENSSPVCWLFSILIDGEAAGIERDELAIVLNDNGVDSRPFFHPLHRQPPYIGYGDGDFPVSSRIADSGISLPTHTGLSKADITFVCDQVKSAICNQSD